MNKKYNVVTLRERPGLEQEINRLHNIGWINYMREDPISIQYWHKLLSYFPQFQFVLLNEDDQPMACGNAIPFYWDANINTLPEGWDKVFEKGILDFGSVQPNTLSALAIVVHPNFRGKGLSVKMVKEMKRITIKHDLENLVAPVRPSLKYKYPLIPMKDYVNWKKENDTPFDPWIRTHVNMGATILKIAEQSMVIPATVDKWEEWTGLILPASGSYIINGGLVPLEVNISKNKGVYTEPNVWLKHHLEE